MPSKGDVRKALVDVERLLARAGLPGGLVEHSRELIRRCDENEPQIMVLGEVTKGKTALVNALLGAKVLPTGVTPTTTISHIVKWGPAFKAWVEHGAKRERVPLKAEQLPEFSGRMVDEYEDPVIRLEYPAPLLKGGGILVDTPGVNDINEQKEELLFEALPAADAAIFVVDARYVLTSTEATFLSKILPESCRTRVILAITKVDRLDEAERLEVQAWAREALGTLGLNIPFVLVSADCDIGICDLERQVAQLLDSGSSTVVLLNLLTRAKDLVAQARSSLREQEAVLSSDSRELGERREELRVRLEVRQEEAKEILGRFSEAIGDSQTSMITDLKHFALEFRQALPQSLEGVSSSDIKAHLPFFIRDTFKEWLDQRLSVCGKEFDEAARVAAAGLVAGIEDLRDASGLDAGRLSVRLDLDEGASFSDIGVAVLTLLGFGTIFVDLLFGGVITAVAAVCAVQFQRNRDKDVVEEAQKRCPEAVDEARKRVETILASRFVDYEEKTTKALSELFSNEVERLDAALSGAEDVERQGSVEGERKSAALLDAEGDFEALARDLAQLKASLVHRVAGSEEA